MNTHKHKDEVIEKKYSPKHPRDEQIEENRREDKKITKPEPETKTFSAQDKEDALSKAVNLGLSQSSVEAVINRDPNNIGVLLQLK